MRVLVIAPYPVFPTSAGGKIRTVQLAREIARSGVDLTVLTPFHPKQQSVLFASEPFRLIQVPYPFLLPLLFTGRPFPFGYLVSFHTGLGLWLRRLMARFEVVQFEQCFLAGLLDHVPESTVVIYNAHNVDCDYISSECRSRLVRSIAAGRVRQIERALTKRASHVFVCSREDGERIQTLYQTPADKINLAPNGIAPVVPTHATEQGLLADRPELKRFPRRALFSGSNVAHNHETVQFIIDELAPSIEQRCAVIIQGPCGKRFQHLRRSNVFIDVHHDTFNTWAVPGTIGLNPIVQGSGTNLKVLHLLAHGMPVISTDFGMRGYDDLREFVTVLDRQCFATALTNADLVSPPAPQWLEERYGWQHIAHSMVEVMRELVASRRTPEGPNSDTA